MNLETEKTYTSDDAGCYIDGVRGLYMVNRIVEIATALGMPEPKECDDDGCGCEDWVHCLYSNEVWKEAEDYMNAEHGVEGHYWGMSEQGDWGLWPVEEND